MNIWPWMLGLIAVLTILLAWWLGASAGQNGQPQIMITLVFLMGTGLVFSTPTMKTTTTAPLWVLFAQIALTAISYHAGKWWRRRK